MGKEKNDEENDKKLSVVKADVLTTPKREEKQRVEKKKKEKKRKNGRTNHPTHNGQRRTIKTKRKDYQIT